VTKKKVLKQRQQWTTLGQAHCLRTLGKRKEVDDHEKWTKAQIARKDPETEEQDDPAIGREHGVDQPQAGPQEWALDVEQKHRSKEEGV